MVEEMPRKSVADLQAECLRLLKMNFITREITGIDLLRTQPTGTGPNWTWKALYPEQTPIVEAEANNIVAAVAGQWAMADSD